MKIEHVAYWVQDLEMMRDFYQKYFGGSSGEIYHNPEKEFRSCFITFSTGCRLELMHSPRVTSSLIGSYTEVTGITHLAFSVSSKEEVDELTRRLEQDDFQVIGKPRTTGDGYYESVVLDPELNRIEITV